ncbi:ABC transporter permease, partial [bacterium]|nr:ABC transporter permease [bacterium]
SPEMHVSGIKAYEYIFSNLFSKIYFIFSLVIPLLTMRLVAEEKRAHTHELMMSLPISPLQYILGKYLAALCFSYILLLLTLICPLILMPFAKVEWGLLLISYLGLFLYILLYTAVGTYFSTLTSNQFIACIATMGFSLSFMILGWLAYISPVEIEKILAALLIFNHVSTFYDGYVYLADVTLFISATFLFLYLAQRKVLIEYPVNT